MPQLPEVLVERLRSGRCVLCAGAGLRVLAGMPNWSGVLDRLIDRLAEQGHELRRPEADLLRDGIYELRASYQGVHYRMLYFFAGRAVVVLSHGLTKEREVPSREIDLAVDRKKKVETNFEQFTFRPE